MSIEKLLLLNAFGSPTFSKFEGKYIQDIATELNRPLTDTLFDLIADTELKAHLCVEQLANPEYVEEMLRNPRILPGASDGGAHNKHFSGGHWSTDMIVWLARETKRFTLEEIHQILNQRAADVFGIENRGLLLEGYAADLMVYDYEKLNFVRNRYVVLHDMPNGDWRRTTKVDGINYILVNGIVTFIDGVSTGATPGQLLSNAVPSAGALASSAQYIRTESRPQRN